MANKIKTTVYDASGNNYTTDVFVEHDAVVSNEVLKSGRLPISLKFFKSQQHKEDGFHPFLAITDLSVRTPIVMIDKELNMDDAISIRNTGGDAIQQIVTDYLKTIWGEENVEEVLILI